MAEFERHFEVDVTWWPFELHPETPAEGRSVDELLHRRGRGAEASAHLNAYAAAAGLTFAPNRWLANSHRALELAEFARDRAAFAPVHEALFRACFVEARNIGDLDVLCAIAQGAGLDPDEFRVECLAGRYAALVDRTTVIAREKGVSSTPATIIDDRFAVMGAQDLAVYVDVLTRLGAKPRETGMV